MSSYTSSALLFHLFLQASLPSALPFRPFVPINTIAIRCNLGSGRPPSFLFVQQQQHPTTNRCCFRRPLSQLATNRPSKTSSSSLAMMSTSTSSQQQQRSSTIVHSSKVLGGDFAGYSATFSPKPSSSSSSGGGIAKLVPVPEHLVPESMIEWGDIPSSLETLASEDWIIAAENDNDEDDGEHTNTPSPSLKQDLERTTITVLPEVGCGIDNLEVTKRSERYAGEESRFRGWDHPQHLEREVVVVDSQNSQLHRLDTETIFQIDSSVENDNDDNEDGDDGTTASPVRIRVSLSVDMPKDDGAKGAEPSLSKLITLRVERQSSPQSTGGTAWSGPKSNSGGLDARSVMNTIGRDIVYGDVFAVKKVKRGNGDPWYLSSSVDEEKGGEGNVSLEGKWVRTVIFPENRDDDVEIERTQSDFYGDGSTDADSIVTLRLPQNILVRYGYGISDDNEKRNGWAIEVSHFGSSEEGGKVHVERRAILRSFGENSSLGDISYWIEGR